MRCFLIIIISVFTLQLTQAQTYEIGLFAGGSNFIGDVGSTYYINPKQPVVGGVFKWNRSPRHSFRFSLLYSELVGDDKKSHRGGWPALMAIHMIDISSFRWYLG